ncbi:bacterioferritin [Myxococcota bacterium]|jgi:bacterioferritin|nr:bacterioferritin [Myxococcota bacterium]
MSETPKPTPADVIALLNEVLTAELTAINQYFLHAKMLANWGFKALAGQVRAESIDEMKHADALIERILYLEGLPNLQRLWALRIGENPRETLVCDLALEEDAIPRLNAGIEACRLAGDNGTRLLLEEILKAEEEHRDWLKTQLDAMDRIGEPNYLAQKL